MSRQGNVNTDVSSCFYDLGTSLMLKNQKIQTDLKKKQYEKDENCEKGRVNAVHVVELQQQEAWLRQMWSPKACFTID